MSNPKAEPKCQGKAKDSQVAAVKRIQQEGAAFFFSFTFGICRTSKAMY